MRSDPECLVCILNQAWNTASIATGDSWQHIEIIKQVARVIAQTDLELSPAENSKPLYDIVSRVTGRDDPYHELKQQSNEEALKLLPDLQRTVEQADNRLLSALHAAVAGNIIDLGIGPDYNLQHDVALIMETAFAIDHTAAFRKELLPGRNLLMLGDNSGEIVFDRILIEELVRIGLEVTYSVKSRPIINDATLEDAELVGIMEMVPVIETGSGHIGVNFDHASNEFLQAFESADLILAKGHGNYETCCDRPENIYFLLKAKCNVVARSLGVEKGAIVFKRNR